MAGTINGSSPAVPGGQGRRRARQPVPRTRTVEFTLTAWKTNPTLDRRSLVSLWRFQRG